ncbi:hypothetical protein KW787_03805 [Candidatus Pacearchaeota archaeon]|nr:hypothetical protein [Candidatus Pacearchaeota archaeon]
MNKKGQFFLIAALVIVSILVGLAAVYTSTTTTKPNPVVYTLSNEISYEGSQVIDHGVFQALSKDEISKDIKNLTEYYSAVNPDKDIVVVYGNQTLAQVLEYDNTGKGKVCFDVGGGECPGIDIRDVEKKNYDIRPDENTVRITISDVPYEFTLKQGENFYIVIKTDTEHGTTVAQG